jgi:hypothetical protein
METVIWIAQGLLAAIMLMAGTQKLARTTEQLLASGTLFIATERFGPHSL